MFKTIENRRRFVIFIIGIILILLSFIFEFNALGNILSWKWGWKYLIFASTKIPSLIFYSGVFLIIYSLFGKMIKKWIQKPDL